MVSLEVKTKESARAGNIKETFFETFSFKATLSDFILLILRIGFETIFIFKFVMYGLLFSK